MQTSLQIFVLVAVVAALVLCGAVYKPRNASDPRLLAALVITGGLIIPICLFVLWNQAHAASRLATLGLRPHPAFRHAVGVAYGTGANAQWVFKVDASPSEVSAFYKEPVNHSGWNLRAAHSDRLILQDDSRRINVLFRGEDSGSTVAFQLKSERHGLTK